MRWEDEPWIKLYTRETTTSAAWEWQTRAIWPEIMKRLDGAGLLHIGPRGILGLAALIRFPVEVVRVGLSELRTDGTITLSENGVLCAPNFAEAQMTRQRDAVRKAESRRRARESALDNASESFDLVSEHVTSSHQQSRSEENRRDQRLLPEVGATAPDSRLVQNSEPDPPRAEVSSLPTVPAVDGGRHSPSGRAQAERRAQRDLITVPAFDLLALYAAYPRKDGRKRGLATLARRIKTPAEYEAVRVAIANYAAQVTRDGTEKKYVKHFDSFVNCWEDYAASEPANDALSDLDRRVLAAEERRRNGQGP